MDDIFDISKIDDVPEEIQTELGVDQFAEEIVKLFTIANRALTINEVLVAHYRMFSATKNADGVYVTKPGVTPKTKRQITLKLYSMSKDSGAVLSSHGRGTYVLREQLELPM